MSDFYKRREQQFREMLRTTDSWLNRALRHRILPEGLRLLIISLKKYIRHCQTDLRTGKLSPGEIDRRRRKIDTILLELWEQLSEFDDMM